MIPSIMNGAHPYCNCCPDYRKHTLDIEDARRITNRVEDIINTFTPITFNDDVKKHEANKIVTSLDFDKPHSHFMCGTCTKVNPSDEYIAFNNLKDVSKQLAYILLTMEDEDTFKSVKRRALDHYRGHFSTFCRALDTVQRSID